MLLAVFGRELLVVICASLKKIICGWGQDTVSFRLYSVILSVTSRNHVLKAGVSRLLWTTLREAINLYWEGGPLAYDLVNSISLGCCKCSVFLRMIGSCIWEVEWQQEYVLVYKVNYPPSAMGNTFWWRYSSRVSGPEYVIVCKGLLYFD